MRSFALSNRSAIVTGAAGGIGRSFAEVLAHEGVFVVCADIRREGVDALSEEIKEKGGKAVGVAFDQTDPESVDHLVRTSVEISGQIDILVNNAALFSGLERKKALDIEPDEWDRVVRADLTGPFLCSRAALPHMIKRGYGKIVNISSSSIFRAENRLAHYVSAKAGLIGLTRALAREYSDQGVCINALSPGATQSGSSISTPEYLEPLVSSRSIKRLQKPADLNGTLLFLCSPMSDFMTGQHLIVDGGSEFQ